jgi:hypothetical protein
MNAHSTDPRLLQVQSLRERLHDAGFRPLAVYDPDVPGPSPGKRPVGENWQERARNEPPAVLTEPIRQDALNTGLLADGLRVIDIDIDNPTIAHRARALAIDMLGDALIRQRSNSPRSLLVYRAADGEPPKRTITSSFGKIEVLGRGQQFVAFGRHHSGAELHWVPEPPGDYSLDALFAVTEEQITAYLTAAADLIGAKKPNGEDDTGFEHRHSPNGPRADALDVLAALAVIPNDNAPDWEFWNKIGMATWAASGGSTAGFAAWCAWSEKNQAHDPAACHERWRHYPTSPPTEIGAGTIFHIAQKAVPGWQKPSAQQANKAGPADSVPLRFTENALAYLFTAEHPDLLYVHEWGKWLRYDAGRWHEDHAVTVFDAARAICAREGNLAKASPKGGKNIAAAINKAGTMSAIERLARHHHKHVRSADLFDADRMELNSPDDTLDIREADHAAQST